MLVILGELKVQWMGGEGRYVIIGTPNLEK